MDQSFNPDKFEQQQLIEKIEAAQDIGSDCYIRSDNGNLTIRVKPGDSSVLSVDSLTAAGAIDFAAVDFSYSPLEAPMQATGSQLGPDEHGAGRFARFIADNPLESIPSLRDLAQRLNLTFGSASDWRVFSGFLNALPAQISDEVLERLVVPLLSAGELPWIPEDSAAVLEAHGWSKERIAGSFSEAELDQRYAQKNFFETTGVPVAAVKTANDLFDAISETLIEDGNFIAVRLICTFIQAHHFTPDTDFLEQIVFPFLDHFGAQGYSDIIQALNDCEHAGSWNAPQFAGTAIPWYGEELA